MAFLEGWGGRTHKVNEEVEAGHHDENLHDLNETERGGYKVNEATGKPINNDGPVKTADTTLSVIEGGKGSEDALGVIPEKEDAAAKWLREYEESQKKAA
jgi:hypothetical protein